MPAGHLKTGGTKAGRAAHAALPAATARAAARIALVVLLGVVGAPRAAHADPCLDAVVSFTPGVNGGFQAELLPGIVLGLPRGLGQNQGSLHVVSLGNGGTITVAFEDNAVVDGPGADFVIFENAFYTAGAAPQLFSEVGIVAASDDGVHFTTFPYDAGTLTGLAGRTPVYANADTNPIDPRPPAAGGDAFDLAAIGLARARYLRITDPGATIPDYGNAFPTPGPGKSGFDLDAVVAIHSDELCAACCDVDGDGAVRPADVLLLLRAAAGTPLAVDACGAPACGAARCGDVDGSGGLDDADAALCLRLASALAAEVQCGAGGECDLPPLP